MSGGSYEYAYRHIEYLAENIIAKTSLRKAFKEHLRKVGKACYDIEWVDSGDYGPLDEDRAIRDCLGKDWPTLALAETIKEAEHVKRELNATIKEATNCLKQKE